MWMEWKLSETSCRRCPPETPDSWCQPLVLLWRTCCSGHSGILENRLERVVLMSAGLRVQDRDLVDYRTSCRGRTCHPTAQTRPR